MFRVPVSEVSFSNKFLSQNGLSYFSYDGNIWHDLYTSLTPSVACIKAFTLTDKIKAYIILNISNNQSNPVLIQASVSDEYGNIIKKGNITFEIEGNNYTSKINDGSVKFYNNFTKGGLNNVTARFESEFYSKTQAFEEFDVNITKSVIIANNFTYYGNDSVYYIKLIDENNIPIKGAKIICELNNKFYEKKSDESGIVVIPLDLNLGNFKCNIEFEGNNKYIKSNTTSYITHKSSIIFPETKTFTFNSNYLIRIVDENGEALKNSDFFMFLNSQKYDLKTNDDGEYNLNINLANNQYIIKILNPHTSDSTSSIIQVVSRIVSNHDISMYIGAKNSFKVQITDDNGNNAKAGETVKFTISQKTYYRQTNDLGICEFPINLKTGNYIIKTEYKGFEVSNKIIIKSTLSAKDKKIKKGKTLKFQAKLVNIKGKILKGKKIIFKIKNKKYSAKTNKKGIATIKIKKLKVGKYTITSIYGKIKNRITVKK